MEEPGPYNKTQKDARSEIKTSEDTKRGCVINQGGRGRCTGDGGPLLSLPVSITLTPAPPSCRPVLVDQSPAGPEWWRCVICPPSPVHPPRPPRFIPRCILVSSEVLISDWASFYVFSRGPTASPPHKFLAQSPALLGRAVAVQAPCHLSLSLTLSPLDIVTAYLKSVGPSARSPVYTRLDLS